MESARGCSSNPFVAVACGALGKPINSCFVRATQAHRPLLARWLQMTHDPRYREAQALPFERRPWHLASDQALLTALLETEDFGQVPFEYFAWAVTLRSAPDPRVTAPTIAYSICSAGSRR